MKIGVALIASAILAAAVATPGAAQAPAEPGLLTILQPYCLAKDGNVAATSDALVVAKYDRITDNLNPHGLTEVESYRKALTTKTTATVSTGKGKRFIAETKATYPTRACSVRVTPLQNDAAARLQLLLKVPFAKIEKGQGVYMIKLVNGAATVLSGPDLPTLSEDIKAAVADHTLRIVTVSFYPTEVDMLYESLLN